MRNGAPNVMGWTVQTALPAESLPVELGKQVRSIRALLTVDEPAMKPETRAGRACTRGGRSTK